MCFVDNVLYAGCCKRCECWRAILSEIASVCIGLCILCLLLLVNLTTTNVWIFRFSVPTFYEDDRCILVSHDFVEWFQRLWRNLTHHSYPHPWIDMLHFNLGRIVGQSTSSSTISIRHRLVQRGWSLSIVSACSRAMRVLIAICCEHSDIMIHNTLS